MVATQIFFMFTIFHPDPWGDDEKFDEHIFQMGGSTTNQLVVTDRVVYFATLFRFEKNSWSQSPKGKECLGTLGGGCFQFEHMPEVIRCQKNSWVLSSIQFELYTFRYLFIISLYRIYLLVVHNHYPPVVSQLASEELPGPEGKDRLPTILFQGRAGLRSVIISILFSCSVFFCFCG